MNPRFLVMALVLALSASACGDSEPSSSSNLPTTTFTQTDLRIGTGADAVNGRSLTVHYTLWSYDPAGAEQKGQRLETSVGGSPFTFVLGANQVIRGWDTGLIGMKVGGQRRLIIPPSLGYGSNPQHALRNTTLVFDIELLNVQ
jgi:FKBP-type peptidyl-prolyl cis-trans isomerase